MCFCVNAGSIFMFNYSFKAFLKHIVFNVAYVACV